MARKRLLFALGLVFFALLLVKVAAGIYGVLAARAVSGVGFVAVMQNDQLVVESVFPDSPAAQAVRAGDRIVSLNGEQADKTGAIISLESTQQPGTPYTLMVRRGGEQLEFELRTVPPPFMLSLFLGRLAISLIPLVLFSTGLAVFLLKPFDKQALLLALMFGALAGLVPYLSVFPAWLSALFAVIGVGSILFFPLFFHFFLIFPEASPILRRFPRLERWVYAPCLLLGWPVGIIVLLLAVGEPSRAWERTILFLAIVIGVYFFACVVGGLISLVVNYHQASQQSRRKLRVVLAGSLCGFAPALLLLAVNLTSSVVKAGSLSPPVLRWLSIATLFTFLLFPLSFAYAIARHQVIPVSLIIRRGIRYLLVARGSVVLEIVTVGVVMYFLMDAIFRNYPMSGRGVGVISGVVAIIVWAATRALHTRVIAPAIDRRFFRRAYNAQQILSELGEALRAMTDAPEMARLVSAKIQDALQTESIAVFLRDEKTKEYACAVASQYVPEGHAAMNTCEGLTLPSDAPVIQRLCGDAQPLAVNFDDKNPPTFAPDSADARTDEERERENEIFRRTRAQLILPVATKEQLFGFVALGPRLGDLPFSGEDKAMLQSVVWQMALALENAQLISRKAEEERLRRELEIASEVQQRLFPQRPPATDNLELAGVCIPARGVGGDYYDFIKIGDSQLGVAIADVAGKGISAALLMSIVQASLRSHAQTARGAVTELVASMNRLLHEATAANSYATFFYAQFDEKERRFTYVNAGHNPPMLVRAVNGAREAVAAAANDGAVAQAFRRGRGALAENEVSLLTTGGPVIGIFESCGYEQETIQVQSGDALLAYTDGVSEAMNLAGEEFGEARLRRVVGSGTHLSAAELSERIVEEVGGWCRDAPQHDDLTFVVVKVK